MDDVAPTTTNKKKQTASLATVAENELPVGDVDSVSQQQRSLAARTEDESDESGSVVEKDNASASGASTSSSDELMFLDESEGDAKRKSEGATASSPFHGAASVAPGRSARLPPRPPVCSGDPEVEGVLPSQPSMVRRMQETNKHDVDPIDARALLPSALLNSGSLDLDGVMEDAATRRLAETKQQEEALLNLIRQKELENLFLAQQQQQQRQQQELLLAASASGLNLELLSNVLNEQCRLSPPGFPPQPTFAQQQQQTQQQQQPQPQQQQSSGNNFVLQQMLHRPRHGRSVSDPTFAFAGALSQMPPPQFQPHAPSTATVDPVATKPLVDQSDALAFLNCSNFQPTTDWQTAEFQQQQQQQTLQANLGGMLSVPNNLTKEIPKMEATTPQRRRKHGPSKSVDFNLMMKQNKSRNNSNSGGGSGGGGGSKEHRNTPLSPSTGKQSVTRAEVKKLVEDQARLGRPTYAPWFRDRPNRNNSSSSSKEGEGAAPVEVSPSHSRSQSLPHVNIVPPASPENNSDPQNPTPKSSGRVGTGVFLPRMPVPN